MLKRWPIQDNSICALVVVLSTAACTALHGGTPAGTETNPPPTSTADGGAPDVEAVDLQVASSVMEPGETTKVTIQVSPPRVHQVQLALLDAQSDAYLGSSVLNTTLEGLAETHLTVVARNQATITVLAQTGGMAARAKVDILERSVADLTVVPMYSGSRGFTTWQVLWGSDLDCDMGYDDPAWERAVTFDRRYENDGFPEYEQRNVSARHPLAVLVKAERFASGCVAGVTLTPKTGNRVEVPISQRLADVSRLSFRVQMNVAAESEFWPTFLSPGSEIPYLSGLTAKFRGSSTSDVGALLDAMAELNTNPDAERFRQVRTDAAWDALLATKLSPEGAQSGLSSRIQRWLQQGATLLQMPDVFVGDLHVHDLGQRGELALATVAGQSPKACGMIVQHSASVSVDAQDMLRVGFRLGFLPSALFTCLADASVAAASDAGVSNVLSALAVDFDCNVVANWMSDPDGQLFESCDTQCGAALCVSALDHMWNRVRVQDLSGQFFEVNAAGKAVLSPDAAVTGVDASWAGTTSFLGTETSISGALRSCEPGTEC